MPVKSTRRRSVRKASRSAKRRSSRSRKSYRFARKSVKRSTKTRRSTRKSVKRSTKARRSYRFGSSKSSKSCRSQSSNRGQILAYYDGAAASYGTIPNCFYKIGSKSLKGGKYSNVDTFAGPDKFEKTDANFAAFAKKKGKAMAHIRGKLRRSGKRSFHVQST